MKTICFLFALLLILPAAYDGANTDSSGRSRFATAKDTATLVATYIGYEPFVQRVTTGQTPPLSTRLKEMANELNTVVITVGSFEASDEKRMTMLKPLDIVTTASRSRHHGRHESAAGNAAHGRAGRSVCAGRLQRFPGGRTPTTPAAATHRVSTCSGATGKPWKDSIIGLPTATSIRRRKDLKTP